MSYWACRLGLDHLVLDAQQRTGDTWRNRYDSLTLFTPRAYSGLPGWPLPGDPSGYPTGTEMGDYLDKYAEQHALPIERSCAVTRLAVAGDGFELATSTGIVRAVSIICATGPFQRSRVPEFAARLSIVNLHSADYRKPGQVPDGRVLVVGGGNSGAQIAEELAGAGRSVTWSVSTQPRFVPQRVLGRDVFWWLDKTGVLNAHRGSRRGRLLLRRGDPVFGGGLQRLLRSGTVMTAPASINADAAEVTFSDGTSSAFDAVIWSTGFVNDYGWLDLRAALGPTSVPLHRDGISTAVPGLGFAGLGWQRSRNSGLVGGVGADARLVVEQLSADRSRLGS